MSAVLWAADEKLWDKKTAFLLDLTTGNPVITHYCSSLFSTTIYDPIHQSINNHKNRYIYTVVYLKMLVTCHQMPVPLENFLQMLIALAVCSWKRHKGTITFSSINFKVFFHFWFYVHFKCHIIAGIVIVFKILKQCIGMNRKCIWSKIMFCWDSIWCVGDVICDKVGIGIHSCNWQSAEIDITCPRKELLLKFLQ